MLGKRSWVPKDCEEFFHASASRFAKSDPDDIEQALRSLTEKNQLIYNEECVNLNPAGNIMSPRAEAMLCSGLGSHPSLGYPGNKYEMGLEAAEQIEIVATQLAAEVFDARYVEIRMPSGAIANLAVFMACARSGDAIISPPPSIGGHATHHSAGCAGLYGLAIHAAPVDPKGYSVDVAALREQARKVQPKLITIGGSMNLFPHPIREIRNIADEVGAIVVFDAAHLCGMIAGKAWQQPLEEGAHVMTMSTYKSLGGPPSGLIVTNDPSIAERLDAVAFPGLTANFDVAKSASLAITLLDWKLFGQQYASTMAEAALALGQALLQRGVPVFAGDRGITTCHQFAVEAGGYGGGHAAAKLLRRANVLTSSIGLPDDGGTAMLEGIRFGTPEIVRAGMTALDMPELADYIADVLTGARLPEAAASELTQFRRRFHGVRFVR
jgi:glycine hydroxymethyltransferase